MNSFVNAITNSPDHRTENGAATFSSSLNACVDLFFSVGASRKQTEAAVDKFKQALKEDSKLAHRILLWARDVRGGAGEREVFRTLLKHTVPEIQFALIPKIVELGRWDDLEGLVLSDNKTVATSAALAWKKAVLNADGLAAKWAPRKGDVALKLRSMWGMTPKQYRKTLVNATNVVEQAMCAKQWNEINFSHVPSVAAARYNAAFLRNATEAYTAYKDSLVKGETKINASAIFPHDVVRGYNAAPDQVDADVINEQWKALPNYLGDKQSDILVMSDVSGSMSVCVSGGVSAMDVSVALGLYISERQAGPFKDKVLTFSSNPSFHTVRGSSITDRIKNLSKADWDMSTNLYGAFKLIVDTACNHRIPAEDMPKVLLILSDMEFDASQYGGRTNFQAAESLFAAYGYKMPKVVFWNLGARSGTVPVRYNEDDVAMVSGFSPAILKSILAGKEFTPESVMKEAVGSSRYDVPGVTV